MAGPAQERVDLAGAVGEMNVAEVQATVLSDVDADMRRVARGMAARVFNASDGAVQCITDHKDPNLYFNAQVRLCDNSLNRKVDALGLWQLKREME